MPPVGYWAPGQQGAIETFVLSPIIPSTGRIMWSGAAIGLALPADPGAARQPVRGGCVAVPRRKNTSSWKRTRPAWHA